MSSGWIFSTGSPDQQWQNISLYISLDISEELVYSKYDAWGNVPSYIATNYMIFQPTITSNQICSQAFSGQRNLARDRWTALTLALHYWQAIQTWSWAKEYAWNYFKSNWQNITAIQHKNV